MEWENPVHYVGHTSTPIVVFRNGKHQNISSLMFHNITTRTRMNALLNLRSLVQPAVPYEQWITWPIVRYNFLSTEYSQLECILYQQTTVNDFASRSVGILQEAMRWAPHTTRSHLIEYLLRMDNTSQGLNQHSGLALATESVLNYAGYNRSSSSLGVITPKCLVFSAMFCVYEFIDK